MESYYEVTLERWIQSERRILETFEEWLNKHWSRGKQVLQPNKEWGALFRLWRLMHESGMPDDPIFRAMKDSGLICQEGS